VKAKWLAEIKGSKLDTSTVEYSGGISRMGGGKIAARHAG
jgi:hypothetical protein